MNKKSLQLARIIYYFQRNTPKCKQWVFKVLYLETQTVCSGRLKNYSLCLCLQCSSKCCNASWCNGLGPRTRTRIVCSSESSKCMMHWYESCPGTASPKEFFIKHSTNMKMMRNLITVSGTLRIEQYCQPLQPLKKNTNDDLTRHSYIANLKITSS